LKSAEPFNTQPEGNVGPKRLETRKVKLKYQIAVWPVLG